MLLESHVIHHKQLWVHDVIQEEVFYEFQQLVFVWVFEVFQSLVESFKFRPWKKLVSCFLRDSVEILSQNDAHFAEDLALEVCLRHFEPWNVWKNIVFVQKISFNEVYELWWRFSDQHSETFFAGKHHGGDVVSAKLLSLTNESDSEELFTWNHSWVGFGLARTFLWSFRWNWRSIRFLFFCHFGFFIRNSFLLTIFLLILRLLMFQRSKLRFNLFYLIFCRNNLLGLLLTSSNEWFRFAFRFS